jgi:L-ribulokinase
MKTSLGIDYGTNSVRALIVRCADGKELGSGVFHYPSGEQGVLLNPKDPHEARQHPGDYLAGLEASVSLALAEARRTDPEFTPSSVIAIGVDTTGSSTIPVDQNNVPLAFAPQFKSNPNAQCWLWKDHTSIKEARAITETAARLRPEYLRKCGGTYSSEWWWSKLWHCLNVDPAVFEAAFSWVELADWIPAVLSGVSDPRKVMRGRCAAGHKAMYADDWGGLPDKEFLTELAPALAALRDRLYDQAYDAATPAGHLCPEWAEKLGLPAGIPVAMGAFDVHYGAVGCGVAEGTLVKVIGTSSCDCGVVSKERNTPDVPGICGIVDGSILPGFLGLEAGQSAVGDLFKWWVEGICQGNSDTHRDLTAEAETLLPGETGLLALDWNNGNRTILVDQELTGLILGQTLRTSRAEIYRALIEASAMGARIILERFAEYGIPVETVVCAGGIAEKNAMLMQIYADVTGRELRVSGSSQACALGSAIVAAVLAGSAAGGYDDFPSAQAAMVHLNETVYRPKAENQKRYQSLFELYLLVHDSFGGVRTDLDLGQVMKVLLKLRAEVTASH